MFYNCFWSPICPNICLNGAVEPSFGHVEQIIMIWTKKYSVLKITLIHRPSFNVDKISVPECVSKHLILLDNTQLWLQLYQ